MRSQTTLQVALAKSTSSVQLEASARRENRYSESSSELVVCDTRDGSVPEDSIDEITRILRDFLERLGYEDPHTPINPRLRKEVAEDVMSWDVGLTTQIAEGLVDTGCSIVESAYPHLSYEHQLFVALYTTYFVYVDDLGNRNLELLGEFNRRYATREDMPDPVLERIVRQFRDIYRLYPRINADAIIASSLETLVGMYIEFSTRDMPAVPGGTMYAPFIRRKTGDGLAYALFNFAKGVRDPSDTSYLQVLPMLEYLSLSIKYDMLRRLLLSPVAHARLIAHSDILSFYKETVGGETDTYICLQATAARKDPHAVLQDLVDETLKSIRMVEDLTASDPELSAICKGHLMGYVEYHIRAGRYRLEDILA
ncbi:terpenoid synthase [Cubamyces lactineus]|nr:terpenoid synthase [Cubamyces lactineus]